MNTSAPTHRLVQVAGEAARLVCSASHAQRLVQARPVAVDHAVDVGDDDVAGARPRAAA